MICEDVMLYILAILFISYLVIEATIIFKTGLNYKQGVMTERKETFTSISFGIRTHVNINRNRVGYG